MEQDQAVIKLNARRVFIVLLAVVLPLIGASITLNIYLYTKVCYHDTERQLAENTLDTFLKTKDLIIDCYWVKDQCHKAIKDADSAANEELGKALQAIGKDLPKEGQ